MEKMKSIVKHAAHCLQNERGVTMLEYGIMASLIAVVVMASVGPLGQAISNQFVAITAQI